MAKHRDTTFVVPRLIRNRRIQHWRTTVMRVCMLSAGICCLLAMAFIKMGVPRQLSVLLLLPALLGILGAVWFAIDVVVKRPVDKVLLGDSLQIWPSRTKYSVQDVSQIEFISDVAQDYDEVCLTDSNHDVQLTIRSQWKNREIGLVVDKADSACLTEWANEHGIPVVGAELSRGSRG